MVRKDAEILAAVSHELKLRRGRVGIPDIAERLRVEPLHRDAQAVDPRARRRVLKYVSVEERHLFHGLVSESARSQKSEEGEPNHVWVFSELRDIKVLRRLWIPWSNSFPSRTSSPFSEIQKFHPTGTALSLTRVNFRLRVSSSALQAFAVTALSLCARHAKCFQQHERALRPLSRSPPRAVYPTDLTSRLIPLASERLQIVRTHTSLPDGSRLFFFFLADQKSV